jgi:hypothetical protein
MELTAPLLALALPLLSLTRASSSTLELALRGSCSEETEAAELPLAPLPVLLLLLLLLAAAHALLAISSVSSSCRRATLSPPALWLAAYLSTASFTERRVPAGSSRRGWDKAAAAEPAEEEAAAAAAAA